MPQDIFPSSSPPLLAERLLNWYDRHARVLPWRSLPGQRTDPYRVWLSEIMLQQTTVVTVVPYFQAFLSLWPSIEVLAAAALDDVLTAWAGLGYYARARNLHKCAQIIVEKYEGRFPEDEKQLRQLPGIGDYTAAAIRSIAYGQQAIVVDGNVERVVARMFAICDPLPEAKPQLKRLAGVLTPSHRCGDYTQAMMDLGATVCTPRDPACVLCPWREDCQGMRLGVAETLPAKKPKAERPTRHGIAFWVLRKDGAVLLRRRPENGLLGGMMEIPSTPWQEADWNVEDALKFSPARVSDWRSLPGVINHTFSHFHLQLSLIAGHARSPELALGLWCPLTELDAQALPTIMRKVIHHALTKAY